MFNFFKKRPEVDEFNIICPKCMIRMEKEVKGDIILDVCKQCGGTWFDKNEVEKLFMNMQNQEAKITKLETEVKQEETKIAQISVKKAKIKPAKKTKVRKK